MLLVRSPILTLENAIAAAAFRIAPERELGLAAWCDKSGVTFVLTDDRGFSIRVNTQSKEVILPVAALEFLWAATHSFFVLFDEYTIEQRNGATQFDVAAVERTRNSWILFQWALNNMHSTGIDTWPSELPAPVRYPENSSDVDIANEIFLCAVAWIIHHEFSHLRLEHTALNFSYSINQEKEADLDATSWILSHCTGKQEYKKRTLGIAAAILALQMLESPGPGPTFLTHPRAVERLHDCLTKAGCSEDDEVFSFAVVVMQIQLAQQGVSVVAPKGVSFQEMLGELMVAHLRHSA